MSLSISSTQYSDLFKEIETLVHLVEQDLAAHKSGTQIGGSATSASSIPPTADDSGGPAGGKGASAESSDHAHHSHHHRHNHHSHNHHHHNHHHSHNHHGPRDPSDSAGSGHHANVGSHAVPTDLGNSNRSQVPSGSQPSGGGGHVGSVAFDAGKNKDIARWEAGIKDAAFVTGLDPNLIGGVVWAESRGNPNEVSRNVDGTRDIGLTQIGQARWRNDVVPNLSEQEVNRIREITGKDPRDLNMSNPAENLIAGAAELAQWIKLEGGSTSKGLRAYNTGEVHADLHDTGGVGSRHYVDNVLTYQRELAQHKRLSEDPAGS